MEANLSSTSAVSKGNTEDVWFLGYIKKDLEQELKKAEDVFLKAVENKVFNNLGPAYSIEKLLLDESKETNIFKMNILQEYESYLNKSWFSFVMSYVYKKTEEEIIGILDSSQFKEVLPKLQNYEMFLQANPEIEKKCQYQAKTDAEKIKKIFDYIVEQEVKEVCDEEGLFQDVVTKERLVAYPSTPYPVYFVPLAISFVVNEKTAILIEEKNGMHPYTNEPIQAMGADYLTMLDQIKFTYEMTRTFLKHLSQKKDSNFVLGIVKKELEKLQSANNDESILLRTEVHANTRAFTSHIDSENVNENYEFVKKILKVIETKNLVRGKRCLEEYLDLLIGDSSLENFQENSYIENLKSHSRILNDTELEENENKIRIRFGQELLKYQFFCDMSIIKLTKEFMKISSDEELSKIIETLKWRKIKKVEKKR